MLTAKKGRRWGGSRQDTGTGCKTPVKAEGESSLRNPGGGTTRGEGSCVQNTFEGF